MERFEAEMVAADRGGAYVFVPDDVVAALGETVTVTVERDTGDRTVTVPEDLRAALAGAGLDGPFAALSYSHQREYVRWIEEAKRPATRERRIAGTVERLQG
jgi:uncharacterized protein YdeI (YjbR/CyaY-like superfamily)